MTVADHRRAGADSPAPWTRLDTAFWRPHRRPLFFAGTDAEAHAGSARSAGQRPLALLLYWLWNLDQSLPKALADAGRGLALPLYRNDNRSVGWWAMVVLLIADATLTFSLVFAYLFLWTTRPVVWPPDGSQVPDLATPAVLASLVLVSYISFEIAERLNRRDRRVMVSACLMTVAILSVAAVTSGSSWPSSLGIDPTRHSYGASVWTLIVWVGMHVAIGALMAMWCLARLWLGMIDSWRCVTLRVSLLWWRFSVVTTVLVVVMVTGFPHAFR